MRRVITDLYSLLLEQKKALEELTALSQDKRRAIMKGDAESLEGLARSELRVISQINSTEKRRLGLLPSIAEELGLSGGALTVGDIAGHAEPEEREALIRLQRELVSMIGAQTRMNAENQELLTTNIEYNKAMLELMVDSEDPLNNFYSGDGKAASDRKKSTGFFDGQV